MKPDEHARHILHHVSQEDIGKAMQETMDAVNADGGPAAISENNYNDNKHFREFRRKLHTLVIRKTGVDITEEQMTPHAEGLFRNCFRGGLPLNYCREDHARPVVIDHTNNPDAND